MSGYGMGPGAVSPDHPEGEVVRRSRRGANRLSTETKSSWKTTEFFAYLAVLLAILISAAVISGDGDNADIFTAQKAWLYVTILTVGYMISRGLAKSGSRDPYWDEPGASGNGAPLGERLKTAAHVLTEGEVPSQAGSSDEPGSGSPRA